jgi:protein tyrosine phosphatase (PTP) superfamily phosphohydrolase (DUF442 family)
MKSPSRAARLARNQAAPLTFSCLERLNLMDRRFALLCWAAIIIPVAAELFLACSSSTGAPSAAASAPTEPWNAATQPRANGSGERVASEDPEIWDFHPLGPINGFDNLYRSASPIRDIEKRNQLAPESAAARQIALERARRLYAKGIRTIVSFEGPSSDEDKSAWIALERDTANKAGLEFVSCPLANTGPDSFETLPAGRIAQLLDQTAATIFAHAQSGGVLFHCSAGHDRTGIVVAYMRIKYQHWPADKAITEMRFYGHNWPKFSANGGASSWHEDKLREIAKLLQP